MKRALLLCLTLAAAQAALAQPHAATGTPAPRAERTLRVASELDFPPLAVVKPDGSADGFSVDLFEAVARVKGHKYHIYTGPWDSIKDDVIAGKADLLINMAINPARAATHDFTVTHTVTQAAVFVRKGSATPHALEDLRGKSLLVVSGDHVQQWAGRQPWATGLVGTVTVEEAMKLLAGGKHDAVLVARVVGLLTLKAARLDNIRVTELSLPGAEQRFAFAVKKGDAELLAQLNDGLASVRADGTYDRLYDHWFDPIEPRIIPLRLLARYAEPLLAVLLALMTILAYRLWTNAVSLRKERVGLKLAVEARTQSLHQSNQQLDFLLNATPAVIYSARPHGNHAVRFISANVRHQLGYEAEEFVRDPGFWSSNIHPDDREGVFAGPAELDAADTRSCEYRYRHKDGSWRWMHDEFTLIRDSSGAPIELVGYWIDVTDRKVAEIAHTRFAMIVEQANEAILSRAPDGVILSWNAAAERLYGYTAAEVIGTDLLLAPPERRQEFLQIRELAKQGKPVRNGETVRMTKDGRRIYVQYSVFTLRDDNGNFIGTAGISSDITDRHRAQAAVEDALRAKTDFMNNITHELRTPLNSVIGFAGLLKDGVAGPLNAKQAVFIADILAGGERLQVLVEGILEMSRLDAAALACAPVDIGVVLHERVAAYRNAAEAGHVSIALEVAADAGGALLDPQALRRMLDALIDNAIKFNREGGTVTVNARRDDGWLEIAVADSGIGIAAEDLAKLFTPLLQLDAGLARGHGGIGIGLALARRLAELHGGTLDVASEHGTGSTFTLRLPVGLLNNDS